MKPDDWPRYMLAKSLKSGQIAYYWNPRQKDIKAGCPIEPEALGTSYGDACKRATFLNTHLDAWRDGLGATIVEAERLHFGTVKWVFHAYTQSEAYKARVSDRSQDEYQRALRRIEDVSTKTHDIVGNLPALSISPASVDKIYKALRIGPRGPRRRQANLSIDIAARAFDVVRRLYPDQLPSENPWRGVLKDLSKTSKPAVTRDDAYALAYKLSEIGEPHLGAAALICFEWHQRPEHVRGGDITWADYRPSKRPDAAFVRHPKTNEKGWLPLDDEDGNQQLYPELEAYLGSLKRLGLPIVLTSGQRGPSRLYSAEHAQRMVRRARKEAGLGDHVTLDSCRHGGLTELGDSGASESEIMALSMHRSPQAARGYIKKTETQRLHGMRKRRSHIEENKPARESE